MRACRDCRLVTLEAQAIEIEALLGLQRLLHRFDLVLLGQIICRLRPGGSAYRGNADRQCDSRHDASSGPKYMSGERLKKALADTERARTLTLMMTYMLGLSNDAIVRRAEASERAVREALES